VFKFEYEYEKIPRYLQIETTIVCQATCWFCPQKKATRRPLFMDMQVVDKILDETRGLEITYRPFILNEPFADKRMPEIVKKIKSDSTARVEFNSNGELVNPVVAEKLFEAGVDTMRFSVDGITKKTFDETRGINFDKVYAHVGNFVKRAQELNHHVKIEVRMIRLPGTEDEQKEFQKYWTDKGAKVVFTDLYSYPWEAQTEAVNKPCLKILDETYIYVDGRVTLCCWDSAERAVVGDVKTENLMDIWNGEKLRAYRELLAVGHRDKIHLCSRCDAYKNLDFAAIRGKVRSDNMMASGTL
jgi:MoaA/NifB/PqqE/SkfB family radical SAM enzyme